MVRLERLNVVHMAAARMGGLMLGYAQKGGIADVVAAAPKLAFFLADEVDFAKFGSSFKVFVGHHGDKGAHRADVILPGATYAEKSGTVNLEGRVQRGERAVFAPGDAREDWAIFRALSEVLGQTLKFDTLDELRAAMAAEVPRWARSVSSPSTGRAVAERDRDRNDRGYPIKDFYLTNAIAAPARRCSAARPNWSMVRAMRRQRSDRVFTRRSAFLMAGPGRSRPWSGSWRSRCR
jgi:NADH-quinone oxidoreductase subunit G